MMGDFKHYVLTFWIKYIFQNVEQYYYIKKKSKT